MTHVLRQGHTYCNKDTPSNSPLPILNFNGCLCILETNNMLGTLFANILPHPVSGFLDSFKCETQEFVIFTIFPFLFVLWRLFSGILCQI